MTTRTFSVTNGPYLERLVDAFKYAYHEDCRVNVTFTGEIEGLSGKRHFDARIIGLVHESGKPGQFIVYGLVSGKRFEGFYDAYTRQGRFQFESERALSNVS